MEKITFLKLFNTFCFVLLFSTASFAVNTSLDFNEAEYENSKEASLTTTLPKPSSLDFTVMARIHVLEPNTVLCGWNVNGTNLTEIRFTNDFKLQFKIPSIGFEVTTEASLDSGCYHVAVMSCNGWVSMYIDGKLEIQAQIDVNELLAFIETIDPMDLENMSISLQGSGGFVISEFALFEYSLTQSQIQWYEANLPTGTEEGLLVAFNFDMPGFPFEGLDLNWVEDVCGVLSTNDVIGVQAASIYPNPSSDYIMVSNTVDVKSYRIFDVSGRQIISKRANIMPSIDVTSLHKGVYFISLNEKKSLKFIKE